MIKVEQYQPSLKPDVLRLIQQGDFKPLIWDWQFASTNKHRPIVVKKDDQVIAFNGVMPISIWCNGQEQEGIWSCDFFVSERARGKGIGKVVKDNLLKLAPRFVMSLGISDTAFKLLLAKGWQSIDGVQVYRKRVNYTRLSQLPYIAAQIANRIKHLNFTSAFTDVAIDAALPDSHSLDTLWRNIRDDYQACVVRNAAYLNWRYSQHPLGQYKYGVAKEDHVPVAILVYKIETDVLRIVDYIGPANAYVIKKSLMKTLLNSMPLNINSMSFTTSDPQWREILFSFGFYCSRAQERFVVLDKNQSLPAKDWFVTGGDSDGDIIQTAIYSIKHTKQGIDNE